VAENDAGNAGNCRARNVFARRGDFDEMPDSRNAPDQMRIVCEQRAAGRGSIRSGGPLVTAEHVVRALAIPRDLRGGCAPSSAGSGGSVTGRPPAVGTSYAGSVNEKNAASARGPTSSAITRRQITLYTNPRVEHDRETDGE